MVNREWRRSGSRFLVSCGLVCGAALTAAVGCGDDDDSTDAAPAADAAPANVCPSTAPDRDELKPPCCYRVSGESKEDSPELRVANLTITDPAGLIIANGLLPTNIENEVINWLIDIEIDGTSATIQTGIGSRAEDGSMSLGLPGYDTIEVLADVDGDRLTSAGPAEDTLIVPLFQEDGETLLVDLILRNLTFDATLSDNGSCIGSRRSRVRWDASEGLLEAFVTVEDSQVQSLTFGAALQDTTLCMLLSGNGTTPGERCADTPRADWLTPPDSLCDGETPETCTTGEGVCDPAVDCNAWRVSTGFAAYGVEITD